MNIKNVNLCAENTDKELWREKDGDYYADSIHVTETGEIGINVGGIVIVKPLRAWHALGMEKDCIGCWSTKKQE